MSAPVETFQAEWELDQLLRVVDGLIWERAPEFAVLEIGSWHGGTLWHWIKKASHVAVIDDEMRLSDEWSKWAFEHGTAIALLQGRSQDTDVVARASELAPFDFVFIDGDHSYEAVRADWENYSPMVADGGVVAFHDILPRPGYGVSEVWASVKATEGARYMEICQNEVLPGNEGRCGVGVLWPS